MNIPTPRRHQKEGVSFFSRCIEKPGYYLRQAPTGTGKSLEIRLFAYYAMTKGLRVIISSVSNPVCNRFALDIANETHNKIRISRNLEDIINKDVVVILTHQSLWRRIEYAYKELGEDRFREVFGSVVLAADEAHHMNLDAVRNRTAATKLTRIVATSATPWPDGITDDDSEYIGSGLFRPGHILRYSLLDAVNDNPPMVCNWKLHSKIPNRLEDTGKTIWFYRDKESISSDIQNHKRRIAVLHTDIIKNENHKRKIIGAFESGAVNDIATCRMLSEGIDIVSAQSVVYMDEFVSPVFLVQSFGRVIRLYGNKIAHAYGSTGTIGRLKEAIDR